MCRCQGAFPWESSCSFSELRLEFRWLRQRTMLQSKAENKYCLCGPESFYCFRALMKTILVFAAVTALASGAFADIQDPPSNDYGPTRKLGRGLSNFFIAPAEITSTVATINKQEGNTAAAGYGVVRALGRSASRHFAGFLEIVTWPFPAWRDSYYPLFPC